MLAVFLTACGATACVLLDVKPALWASKLLATGLALVESALSVALLAQAANTITAQLIKNMRVFMFPPMAVRPFIVLFLLYFRAHFASKSCATLSILTAYVRWSAFGVFESDVFTLFASGGAFWQATIAALLVRLCVFL